MMLTITSRTEDKVYISSPKPLATGTLVEFLPSKQRGAVGNYLGNKIYEVSAKVDRSDRTANVVDWWSLKQPPSFSQSAPLQFFETSDTAANLDITIRNLPSDHRAGSLGWDLWYSPDREHPWFRIAAGNDLTNPGNARGSIERASWPSGLWLFRAKAFYKTNLVPVSAVELSWQEPVATNVLVKTLEMRLGS
jgi:hypothetical protein